MTLIDKAFLKPGRPITRRALILIAGAMVLTACMPSMSDAQSGTVIRIPPPASDIATATQGAQETAVLAGGCFWGVQAVFQHTKGVVRAVSGYAGGSKETANYASVSSGKTEQAESVEITYDPKQISYGKLLQIYFSVAHDPTQLNRQFPDVGTQYRSAIFYKDDDQKRVAEQYIAQLNAAQVYRNKIVTQLTPFAAFYPAEGYHQDYATLHPESGYIARFDLPKIANLKSLFPEQYRQAPVLVTSQDNAKAVKGK